MHRTLYEFRMLAEMLYQSRQLTHYGYQWLLDYCDEVEEQMNPDPSGEAMKALQAAMRVTEPAS